MRALVGNIAMHRSICEASGGGLAAFLNLPFNQNPCRIAGGVLGRALAVQLPEWDFGAEGRALSDVGRRTLWLLTGSHAGSPTPDSLLHCTPHSLCSLVEPRSSPCADRPERRAVRAPTPKRRRVHR